MDSSTRLTIGEVRFNYARVFEPDEKSGDKYGVTISWAKDNSAITEKIKEGLKAAYNEGLARGIKVPPQKITSSVKDGDVELNRDGDQKMPGNYYLKLSSKFAPEVVKRGLAQGKPAVVPITDTDEFYSGCFGYATFNFVAYDHPSGGKGITATLYSVFKSRDGEKIGGGGNHAAIDYADIVNEAPGDMPDFDI